MNTFRVQWRNYKWVNFCNEDGYPCEFKTIEDAKQYLIGRYFNRDVEVRICEYCGGHEYKELENYSSLRQFMKSFKRVLLRPGKEEQ